MVRVRAMSSTEQEACRSSCAPWFLGATRAAYITGDLLRPSRSSCVATAVAWSAFHRRERRQVTPRMVAANPTRHWAAMATQKAKPSAQNSWASPRAVRLASSPMRGVKSP